MDETYKRFIVIDDDPMNNKICSFMIRQTFPQTEVILFTDGRTALDFFEKEYFLNPLPTILFVDINMPQMTGWEVLEKFKNFSEEMKSYFKIFMLTSSVDERDKERAANEKLVKKFLSKPLTKETLMNLFN